MPPGIDLMLFEWLAALVAHAAPARQKRWTLLDRLTFVWCVACFGIHFVLEGYFAVNNRTITTDMSFLGQVCT